MDARSFCEAIENSVGNTNTGCRQNMKTNKLETSVATAVVVAAVKMCY